MPHTKSNNQRHIWQAAGRPLCRLSPLPPQSLLPLPTPTQVGEERGHCALSLTLHQSCPSTAG